FDADKVLAKGLDRVVGQPRVELFETFFTGVDFHPRDPACAPVGLLHRRVEDAHARTPDVGTRAVAFDEWNDRIVGNDEPAALARDRRTGRWRFRRGEVRHSS